MRASHALVVAALAVPLLAVGLARGSASSTSWCGTGEVTADRAPETTSALAIHVIYAYPADGVDRFSELASPIASDLAAIDRWWRRHDPTRTPRFDLFAFGGCDTALGALDLSSVRLPHDAAYYARERGRWEAIRADLAQPPFDFSDPDKKYLVYYDGSLGESNHVCGESNPTLALDGGRMGYAIAYLAGECGHGLGRGGAAAFVAAHELLHGLHAVPLAGRPRPPHACPRNRSHACDNPADILYPFQSSSATLDAVVLDSGHDDYYAHEGAWWDVQDSPFLARLDAPARGPLAPPTGLTATGDGRLVTLAWQPSASIGPIWYRVHADGTFLGQTSAARFSWVGEERERFAFALRAVDTAGLLSPPETIRFEIGLGIVDASGGLVRDTVAPPEVVGLSARRTRNAVLLTWLPVRDRGGLKGYRIERNGVFYAFLAKPRLRVPLAKAPGRWRVRAVDRAGNLGSSAELKVASN